MQKAPLTHLNAAIFNVGPHGDKDLRQLEVSGGTGQRQQTLALFRCLVDGMTLSEMTGSRNSLRGRGGDMVIRFKITVNE